MPSQPQASFHRVFVPRDSDLEAQLRTECSLKKLDMRMPSEPRHYLDEYLRSNGLDVSGIPITYHLIPVRPTGTIDMLRREHRQTGMFETARATFP